MHVNVTFRHMDASDSLRDYVRTKVQRLDKYCDGEASAHAILDSEKIRQHFELVIELNRIGPNLTVRETADDMHAAIDLTIDKAERQLVKRKEKLKSRVE